MAARRAEGRKRGGTSRSKPAATLPADVPDLRLVTAEDIGKAIATTFNDVRKGKLDARVGNCLAVLAGVILKTVEVGDLARQMIEVRERLDALDAASKGGPRR